MDHTTGSSGTGASGADSSRATSAPDGDSHTRELQAGERNRLLRGLPIAAYTQLLPHLEPVEIPAGQVLWRPDTQIHAVYFPRTVVCSILTPLIDEAAVESATIGFEGLVGVPVVLGATSTHSQEIGQVAGRARPVTATAPGVASAAATDTTTTAVRPSSRSSACASRSFTRPCESLQLSLRRMGLQNDASTRV